MQNFYPELAYILREESVTAETRFRDLSFWSSLTGFEVLVHLESEYNTPMTPNQLLTLNTCGDLYNYVQTHRIA